jgi:hypothetical protein
MQALDYSYHQRYDVTHTHCVLFTPIALYALTGYRTMKQHCASIGLFALNPCTVAWQATRNSETEEEHRKDERTLNRKTVTERKHCQM